MSTEPCRTQTLSDVHNERVTRPLQNSEDTIADLPTVLLPRKTRPLNTPISSTKQPLIIPATTRRLRTDQLKHRRSPIVLVGVLLGSIVVVIFASLVAVPLDNSQQQQNLVETVNNWFTGAQSDTTDLLRHVALPTATPALLTHEGYCGGSDIWGTCAKADTISGVMGSGQMQRPIIGAVITQPFAHPEYQLWCGCWKPHTGIDLAAPYGSPILAADSGQVIWTGWDWSGLGWAVKISHGNYIATIYGHLQRFIVNVGQNVTRGEVIAYEGSTGASTGPHLHFMVLNNNIWVNPVDYVQLP